MTAHGMHRKHPWSLLEYTSKVYDEMHPPPQPHLVSSQIESTYHHPPKEMFFKELQNSSFLKCLIFAFIQACRIGFSSPAPSTPKC